MNRSDTLIQALRAAGQIILTYDPSTVKTGAKTTAGDLVTAADLASEKIITDKIKAAFPEDIIISEETDTDHHQLTDYFTGWVVDPLDGTNNFKSGMAYSGISIGYIKSGQIVLGGIYDPYRDKLYFAEIDKGAACNEATIHVSDNSIFDTATRVCTSNSYENTTKNLARYAKLGPVWVDVLGSAVLIMADIASGSLDLYHHNGLKPWDNAAGFLIASEAGAKIVGFQGQPVNWISDEAVMGNPALVDLFIEKINNPDII